MIPTSRQQRMKIAVHLTPTEAHDLEWAARFTSGNPHCKIGMKRNIRRAGEKIFAAYSEQFLREPVRLGYRATLLKKIKIARKPSDLQPRKK